MSLAEDMIESDAAFRKQFDPQDPSYHSGDRRAVPVGGSRVPADAAADEAAAAAAPAAPAVVDYGPEHDALMKLRTNLGEFKKRVNAISMPLDAVVRARLAADTAAAASEDAGEKAKTARALAAALKRRNVAVEALQELKGTAFAPENAPETEAELVAELCADIDAITAAACDDADFTKEKQDAYGTLVKTATSKVFSKQRTLLDAIKLIKKQKQQQQQ